MSELKYHHYVISHLILPVGGYLLLFEVGALLSPHPKDDLECRSKHNLPFLILPLGTSEFYIESVSNILANPKQNTVTKYRDMLNLKIKQ